MSTPRYALLPCPHCGDFVANVTTHDGRRVALEPVQEVYLREYDPETREHFWMADVAPQGEARRHALARHGCKGTT